MLNKQDLSLEELMLLNSELRGAEKSSGVAYLMLLGGHFGLHRFYLKRKGTGAAQLALFIAAIFFYFMIAIASAVDSTPFTIVSVTMCVLPAVALFVWIIVDLFLLPGMIRAYNQGVQQAIIAEILHYRKMEQLAGRG
ncbi:TM2 domain-containing protein [Paenibacillus rhizovicinus]|uniref:TM2 domain-containing protein n=1 Tax=Paenibacillus rhizovicinus TaxID=2704463 RepID=A0A6C0P3U5_9BACL|nr:TM2 domain-containing protein [Paenibacillus rhizovicinus]QHW33149.1 TM2 domain-containing protein [Paenibacillus rhizovicinus]